MRSVVKPFRYDREFCGDYVSSTVDEDYSPGLDYWDRLVYTAKVNDLYALCPQMVGEDAEYDNGDGRLWKYPDAIVLGYGDDYEVMVNPVIVREGRIMDTKMEYSLLDGKRVLTCSIERPFMIDVKYCTVDLKQRERSLSGLSSRYFQQCYQLMHGTHMLEIAKPLALKFALKRYFKKEKRAKKDPYYKKWLGLIDD